MACVLACGGIVRLQVQPVPLHVRVRRAHKKRAWFDNSAIAVFREDRPHLRANTPAIFAFAGIVFDAAWCVFSPSGDLINLYPGRRLPCIDAVVELGGFRKKRAVEDACGLRIARIGNRSPFCVGQKTKEAFDRSDELSEQIYGRALHGIKICCGRKQRIRAWRISY